MERGWRSGPRLPGDRRHRPPQPDDDDESVVRCDTCMVPATSAKITEFALSLGGRQAGRYGLCERCWRAANRPQPVDPLDVSDAA